MNDDRRHEEQLAAWADQALKQLPARRAPATLAPRVLAALAKQRVRAWYRQPWLNWPRHFQVLSFLLFAGALAATAWFLLPHAEALTLANAKQTLAQSETVRPVSAAVSLLSALGSALVLVLGNLKAWVVAAALGGLAFLYCSCLGLGTACWRLATGTRAA
ncbi:MAG TPA: hypothetical protein VMB21_01565 [Candidatus Limnocylindria bacterium]|nr:hypothetical protein [Candidatus Limnocylindria bacterium]